VKDVIIFRHQGKCGGTSLRASIHESKIFKPEEVLYAYASDVLGRAILSKECKKVETGEISYHDLYMLVNKELADGKIKFVYGHYVPPSFDIIEKTITSRKFRLFTMFRHPYTRFISLYNHRRKHNDMNMDFEEWISSKYESNIYKHMSKLNSHEAMIESYSKYEKILFYEEYKKGLEYMSNVVGKELKEYQENKSTMYVKRSEETDKLIEKYRSGNLKMYDEVRRRFA
jgi:hypothetical protein